MPSDSSLEAILAPGGLTVRFQPILELRTEMTRLHSVEALVRGPRGTSLEKAEILFGYVRGRHEESRVDRACVTAICAAASDIPGQTPFSINVHAVTLAGDRTFLDHLLGSAARHSIEPRRITLEIVEHAPAWAGRDLGEVLDGVRQAGLRIALDDVGVGQSNYHMMLACRPDFLKVDRYFVAGCHRDSRRHAVLESVVRLGQKLGARVVAEGVEGWPDLRSAMGVGIDLFQGFLFSPALRPSELARAEGFRAPDRGSPSRWSDSMQAAPVPST